MRPALERLNEFVNSDCIDVAKCQEEIVDEYDGGYFINSISICFSVNKNSRNIDMANEFMRFLISKKELGNMAGLKRLIPPVDDFSSDEIYSALADIPADRSFSDKETGLLDPAVRQFRAAIYAVGNGEMTVDEAVAAYGSIPEE